MKLSEMEAVIESMLFLSGSAEPLAAIAGTIGMDKATTRALLNGLADRYVTENRGLRLVELEGCWQLCTAPVCYTYLRDKLKGSARPGVSPAQLETLAIVAYKQPVTRGEIEELRGVSSDYAVQQLLDKGLIAVVGQRDTPGKPAVLGTTQEFLRAFGVRSLTELPPLAAGVGNEGGPEAEAAGAGEREPLGGA